MWHHGYIEPTTSYMQTFDHTEGSHPQQQIVQGLIVYSFIQQMLTEPIMWWALF